MEARKFQAEGSHQISVKVLFIVFVCSGIVSILRRPDVVLNPQFWAEDGLVWFSQMLKDGWLSVFSPRDGYFQTISRVAAGVAALLPLDLAPLAMNSFFLSIKAALVTVLVSSRTQFFFASRTLSFAAAIFVLLAPDAQEVHGNVTNAHWFLSLLALILILAKAPTSNTVKVGEFVVVLIASVSGPFSIIIAPLVSIWGWCQRKTIELHSKLLIICLGTGASLQLLSVLFTGGARSDVPLGSSPFLLLKILSSRVFGPVFFGTKSADNIWESNSATFVIGGLGLTLVVYGFIRASGAVRLILLFGALQLAAALFSPMIASEGSDSHWALLDQAGGRYFAIPIICVFFTFLVTAARVWQKTGYHKFFVIALGLCVMVTLRNEFAINPLQDCQWGERVADFQSGRLERGIIAINPMCEADRWYVDLSPLQQ